MSVNNNIVTSVAGKDGDITLVKSDVNLGNVDNTSDIDKPISTAQQIALDDKAKLVGGNSFTGGSQTIAATSSSTNAIAVTQGYTLLGSTTPQDITGTSTFPSFQILGTSATQMVAAQYSNDINPPAFNLLKSRGVLNAQGLVSNNDEVGRLQFRASDGVNFQAAASVRVAVDGIASANSMPGRLLLLTTPLGSIAPLERLRITSTGQVSINQAAPNASAILQVDSTTQGLLPPRMTTAQRLAITSPATGIVVYDINDNAMYCFDGNFWTCMSGIYKANNNTTLTNNSNTTLTNVTDMAINVVNGKTYIIDAYILFRSVATNTGIALTIGATGASGTMNCCVDIPIAADGTGASFHGQITALGDIVIGTGVQAANTDYLARIEGFFTCTSSGTIYPQFRSELNASTITFQPISRWNLREV